MSQASAQVVWFKRDLRIHDHAPLLAAAEAGPVAPLYIIEPEYWRLPDVSRRHWLCLRDGLIDLAEELAQRGAPLIVRIGDAVEVLEDLRQRYGDIALWSHEETGNAWTYRRDLAVAAWAKAHGVVWRESPSHGVIRRLKTRDGWAKIRDARMAEAVLPAPQHLRPAPALAATDALPAADDRRFGPGDVGSVQTGGRSQALSTLESFLKRRARNYRATLSKPGVSARHCSRLSAAIAYGALSVREIEHATKARLRDLAGDPDPGAKAFRLSLSAFSARLAWRCHFVQKLEQQPRLETHCLHPAFEGLREGAFRDDYFEAWKAGRTGYPLIDACMRSLHDNGWITFRMRALLVSFASYHLWLDWRQTAPHLARLFTDYEPGIHFSQFQMQSGVTGINTLRIYNPVKQSLDHDPEGAFIRRYVPELQEVSAQWVHTPWRLPEPPASYPLPIVEQVAAVKHAKAEIALRRAQAGFRDEARTVHQKLGSRKSPSPRRPARRKPAPTQLCLDL